MQLKPTSTRTVALILSALSIQTILAQDFICDATQLPDYSDCDTIIDNYNATNMAYNAQFAVSGNPSVCRYLNPPPGTDPNSLNCVIEICPHQDVTSLYVDLFGTAYGQIKSVCTNTGNQDGGGQLDTNQGYRMLVRNNPNFFQQKKRSVERKDRRSRLRAEENALEKRASSCAGGSGSLNVVTEFKGVSPPQYYQYITTLPPGGTYLTQMTDTKMIGVDVSISVEAGFFDLFSTTIGTTVSSSMSVSSTTGIMVSNPCETGQDAALYLTPSFTEYDCICNEDSSEIVVDVPDGVQNIYMLQCLG